MNVSHHGLFLNKIIEDGTTDAITRYSIDRADMKYSDTDLATFDFIVKYVEENGGETPSYAVVASNVDNFEYVPEVSDSYEYLVGKIKDTTATQAVLDLFKRNGNTSQSEFERQLNELGGREFVEKWLPSVLESVRMRTRVRTKVGTDVLNDYDEYLEEYERRKEGESHRIWASKFESIGDYVGGNVYVVYGESGRGKSIITLEDAIYAAQQGANVLIWAMEMAKFEVMTRIYVSLSGDRKITTAFHDGVNMGAGFNASDLRRGKLADDFEQAFRDFVETINDYVDGSITLRAVDDADFKDRSLKALETDIEETDADYVLIDPFYYLHYERNTSRTTGGDASNTSMSLRALAGRKGVVVIAITQADSTSERITDDEARELKMPARDGVKKTASLLEDAAVLIGVDSDWRRGMAIVGNIKGRDGGEGDITNVTYLPQYGVIDALETGEEAIADFNF